jgi:hypothetical protein
MQPVSQKYMEKEYPKNSICQVLRDIYHRIPKEDIETRMDLRLAVGMAKAMQRRLQRYKLWKDSFWEDRG